MKRIIVYIAIMAALLLVPIQGADVGKLQPIEVAFVYRAGKQIVLETDTGDKGVGNTGAEALQNLKDTTPGIIYLDTAEYLLLTEDAQEAVEQLRPLLKKSVQVCTAEPGIDLALAAQFLPAHGKLPQLKQWQTGALLPHLTSVDKRLILS